MARKNGFLKIGETKVHFIKHAFPVEKMKNLARELLKNKLWEFKADRRRGPKDFFITGRWHQQGHTRPGIDKTYPAGKAGKAPLDNRQPVESILDDLTRRACDLLAQYRPDIVELLGDIENDPDFSYGFFHLFMAARGLARLHKDQNDIVSLMFLIQSPGSGGELEIGGTGTAIGWQVGDVVIMDTADITHGTRDFFGEDSGRIVGLFIIHKPFLRLKDIL